MMRRASRHVAWHAVRILFVATALSGCATIPPAKELQPGDLKSLVGKWEGSLKTGKKTLYPVRTRIREDGSFETMLDVASSSVPLRGTMQITAGGIRYEDTSSRGSITLHEGERFGRLLKWEGTAKDGSGAVSLAQAPYKPLLEYQYHPPAMVKEPDREECGERGDWEAKKTVSRMSDTPSPAPLSSLSDDE